MTAYIELRILAESFEDAQRARISCTNRMERGGVPADFFVSELAALASAENVVRLALVRRYRRLVRSELHGVDEWQRAEFGIGEHLLARLLGHLGHPRVASPYHWEGEGASRKLIPDLPYARTLAQLRAYCGHGDPTRRPRRGMTAEEAFALGNPRCKMLVHLLAEATIKCRPIEQPLTMVAAAGTSSRPPIDRTSTRSSPADEIELPAPAHRTAALQTTGGLRRTFRSVYDARRVATADRVHVGDCVRCGPSGKPATVGSPWSAAHQHADALRVVGKEILADLWQAAR